MNDNSNFDFEYIIEADKYIILYPISDIAKHVTKDFLHFELDKGIKMSIYNKDLWTQSGFILKERKPN